jgi:hypothetical protein
VASRRFTVNGIIVKEIMLAEVVAIRQVEAAHELVKLGHLTSGDYTRTRHITVTKQKAYPQWRVPLY